MPPTGRPRPTSPTARPRLLPPTARSRLLPPTARLTFLNVGLLAVALRKEWSFLVQLGAIGTALTELAWFAKFFDWTKLTPGSLALFWFAAFFATAVHVARRRGNETAALAVPARVFPPLSMLFVIWLCTWPDAAASPFAVFFLQFLLCLLGSFPLFLGSSPADGPDPAAGPGQNGTSQGPTAGTPPASDDADLARAAPAADADGIVGQADTARAARPADVALDTAPRTLPWLAAGDGTVGPTGENPADAHLAGAVLTFLSLLAFSRTPLQTGVGPEVLGLAGFVLRGPVLPFLLAVAGFGPPSSPSPPSGCSPPPAASSTPPSSTTP